MLFVCSTGMLAMFVVQAHNWDGWSFLIALIVDCEVTRGFCLTIVYFLYTFTMITGIIAGLMTPGQKPKPQSSVELQARQSARRLPRSSQPSPTAKAHAYRSSLPSPTAKAHAQVTRQAKSQHFSHSTTRSTTMGPVLESSISINPYTPTLPYSQFPEQPPNSGPHQFSRSVSMSTLHSQQLNSGAGPYAPSLPYGPAQTNQHQQHGSQRPTQLWSMSEVSCSGGPTSSRPTLMPLSGSSSVVHAGLSDSYSRPTLWRSGSTMSSTTGLDGGSYTPRSPYSPAPWGSTSGFPSASMLARSSGQSLTPTLARSGSGHSLPEPRWG